MAASTTPNDRNVPAIEAVDENSPLLRRDEAAALCVEPQWNIQTELWLLVQYSLPLIGTYLLQYSFTIITTLVAGHLSPEDLAATSIGLTTYNLVGLATFEGMATALDTLCSQAYGTSNYHGVGLLVQRMLLFMAVTLLPICTVWLLSPWILPLFVKQEYLAAKAASFLYVSLIGLPAYAAFEALKRFLQTQGDCNAALVILLMCAPINAGLSWLLAFKLDLGLEGAALGAALTNNVRVLLLVLYIIFIAKKSHKCWGGFSRDALRNWGPMVRLSFAGSALNLGEWMAFEIAIFSTSFISTNHLAAMTILSQMSVITWHIPFSVSVAVSIRIGHLIGAAKVETAKRVALLYVGIFTVLGSLNGIFFFTLRSQIPRVITNDDYVSRLATKTMYIVAMFQVVDALNVGVGGILRGLGRQSFSGMVVFPINYLIAVPFAIWLELGSPHLKLGGTWFGLALGMALNTTINCVYMKLISWEKAADQAQMQNDGD